MADSALNFNSAQLQNSSVELVRDFNFLNDAFYPGFSIFLFFFCVWASVTWVNKNSKNKKDTFYKIKNDPSLLKASLLPTLLAFALTHVFSAISVYYNTKIVNPSTVLYFQAMGVGRLSSLSHAHFFAHATMYLIMAFLVQMTEGSKLSMVVAPLLALWAGIFDVVSWWGIKILSPHFEYLAMLTGMSFSLSFLFMATQILKSSLSNKD